MLLVIGDLSKIRYIDQGGSQVFSTLMRVHGDLGEHGGSQKEFRQHLNLLKSFAPALQHGRTGDHS